MIKARLTQLNKKEVLVYLGYTGQKYSEDLDAQIDRCMEEVTTRCTPRLVYKILPLNNGRCPDLPLEGNDIRKHLSGCSSIVIMAATVGTAVSDLVRQRTVTDMAQAAILNSCGSAAIENVCDNFESDMRSLLGKKGQYLTDRYSPGYGDLPLITQKQLCALLDTERKTGITLTESMLMVPEKSVTSIMGISDSPVQLKGKDCSSCSMNETCSFKRAGLTCSD